MAMIDIGDMRIVSPLEHARVEIRRLVFYLPKFDTNIGAIFLHEGYIE